MHPPPAHAHFASLRSAICCRLAGTTARIVPSREVLEPRLEAVFAFGRTSRDPRRDNLPLFGPDTERIVTETLRLNNECALLALSFRARHAHLGSAAEHPAPRSLQATRSATRLG
jgi:hypothetical protein